MKFTAISLFSGAGGMDVGFVKAGFDVIWASEINPHAARTFRANHHAPLFEGDIRAYLDDLPETADVVFGGPPCQGFSVRGKMDVNDPRSSLVFAFLEAVRRTRPRVFVMENVKALAVNPRFAAMRHALQDRAAELGYACAWHLLNAKDFGVPQSRERLFIVGCADDSLVDAAAFAKYRKAPVALGTLLRYLGPPGTARNPATCHAAIHLVKNPVLRKSPYAGMLFNGPGRPLDLEGVACTLVASMGGSATPIVDDRALYQGRRNWVEGHHARLLRGLPTAGEAPPFLRRLTVLEAAAIQSFPPRYRWRGPVSSRYAQIGNAVPPVLARAIAKTVLDVLEDRAPVRAPLFA